MTDCPCGKSVRLRAYKVRLAGMNGVSNYIEHTDGTPVCDSSEWGCTAFKPYAKDESEREYSKMVARWEAARGEEK